MEVVCPRCRHVFEESAHIVGRWGVKCPACGRVFENSSVRPALRRAGLWHPGHDSSREKCDTLLEAMEGGSFSRPVKRQPLSMEEYQRLEDEEDRFTVLTGKE